MSPLLQKFGDCVLTNYETAYANCCSTTLLKTETASVGDWPPATGTNDLLTSPRCAHTAGHVMQRASFPK